MASKAPKMLIQSRSFENSFIGRKMMQTVTYSLIEQFIVLSPIISAPFLIPCKYSI